MVKLKLPPTYTNPITISVDYYSCARFKIPRKICKGTPLSLIYISESLENHEIFNCWKAYQTNKMTETLKDFVIDDYYIFKSKKDINHFRFIIPTVQENLYYVTFG